MEINTEINKVFGQEMAKLFCQSMDEKELKQKAQDIWREITKKDCGWGSRSDSELEKYIKNEFMKETLDEVKKILAEPQNMETVKARAREMVDESRRIAEKAIIESMATHMVENTLSVYNAQSKFTQDVMNTLNLKEANQWR